MTINSIRGFCLSFIVFLILACSYSEADYSIKKGCVESVCLRDESPDLLKRFDKHISKYYVLREGDRYPALKIELSKNSYIIAELENDRIWAIRIEDRSFFTSKHINVGKTFSQVRNAYPSSVLNFGEEEGGFVTLHVKEIDAFFIFNTDSIFSESTDFSNISTNHERRFSDLVVEMILLQDPDFF